MRRLVVILFAMVEAFRTVTHLVWRAGRWITESVAAPRATMPAAVAQAEEAVEALAEAG